MAYLMIFTASRLSKGNEVFTKIIIDNFGVTGWKPWKYDHDVISGTERRNW